MKIISKQDSYPFVVHRGLNDYQKEKAIVCRILEKIRTQGDKAISFYTKKFDHVNLSPEEFKVPESVIRKASVSQKIKKALAISKKNIENYQKKILIQNDVFIKTDTHTLGMRVQALDRIGIYIPSGSAPLLSTVLMTVIPATVAGVKDITVMSPPSHNGDIHPAILYACCLCGVDHIYRIGGVQAIGGLAYGTKTIPFVDKIVGPGNLYVSLAKKEVFGDVAIDSIAGPSEIMIVADQKAPIDWVATDLMAQAEHDPLSTCYLICLNHNYAKQVAESFEKKMKTMPRKCIIQEVWKERFFIFVVDTTEEAIPIINKTSPEHLELMCSHPQKLLTKIRHAGAIFMGYHTPEAVGDYIAGPSHVLPTNRSSRFFSSLSALSFLKTSSIISYQKSFLKQNASAIIDLASLEELQAHADSIKIRITKKESLL